MPTRIPDEQYNAILAKVIDGIKNDIPISKTLKENKIYSATFYSRLDLKTRRYLSELKRLRTQMHKSYRGLNYFVDDTANLNIIDN